jgi:hypothetical protein
VKNEIKSFIHNTITSRKFWAAVAASVPLALARDWQNFAIVWIAYAGIQGAVDAAQVFPARPKGSED